MRQNLLTLCLLAICCSLGSLAMAQQYPSLGFTYRYHNPVQDMAQAYYQPTSGWGLNWLSPALIQNAPVRIQMGADFSFDFGDKVELTQQYGDPFFTEGTRTIQNKVAGLHGELRLTTNMPGNFQLFTQGLLGTQRFASSETIEIPLQGNEDFNKHDNIDAMYTLSYGAGAGFRWEAGVDGMALEIGATYLWGQNGRSLNTEAVASGETPKDAFQFMDYASPQRFAVRAGVSFPMGGDCSPSRCSCSPDREALSTNSGSSSISNTAAH